jgi:hypothetical protein
MQGKIQVIGAILKLDRPFKPPHITDMTGLDRQLVRYHIRAFTERDYLEKIDKSYVIKDKEGLLTSMVDASEKTETAKMVAAGIFNKQSVDKLNFQAESIIAGRTLELPMSQESKEVMLRNLDQSVRDLKNLRKYLTNATKTKGSAAKFFKDPMRAEEVWQIYVRFGVGDVDLAGFKEVVSNTLEEILDGD